MLRQRATSRVRVLRFGKGSLSEADDEVVAEEPLEVWIEQGERRKRLGVTMRTPGHDEELAVGLLYAEGLIGSKKDVRDVAHEPFPGEDQEFNSVRVRLSGSATVDWKEPERRRVVTSACGVCGRATIDDLRRRATPLAKGFVFDAKLLEALPDRLRAAQGVFAATGGIHAAALVSSTGRMDVVREDVGRHNAVDKLVGRRLLDGAVPIKDRLLLVSGRAGFEIVQKAVRAGIPFCAAVGAPSSLAVDVAREFGATLVGFLREGRFNLYAGPERLVLAAAARRSRGRASRPGR